MSNDCPFCGNPTPVPPFTVKEVEQAIDKYIEDKVASNDFDDRAEYFDQFTEHDINLKGAKVTVKLVDSYQGEGDGVSTYVILGVEGRYFKQEGYYSSYDGNDWDGRFSEVKGVEKTITEWV